MEGVRATMCHVYVCAVCNACDEAGVGAAEADFVGGACRGVLDAELEVVLGVSRMGVEFPKILLKSFYFCFQFVLMCLSSDVRYYQMYHSFH